MPALLILFLAAALLASPAQADPFYRLGSYDWFNLAYSVLEEGNEPLESAGGPQSLGNGMQYSWDLATGPGQVRSQVDQSSDGSTTLSTRRASELLMRFDDVVFSDGSGSGGVIQVRMRVLLDAVVSGSGANLFSEFEMTGSGGLAGRWYAGVYNGAPPSNGVFTGIDGVDELQGVFLSNPFSVAADEPTDVELRIYFLGSAGGGDFSNLAQELVATFDPGQAFQLPGGYTADSGQAGIVDNQWSPATAVTPLPAGGLALRAWPNPFHPATRVALVMPVAGSLEVVLLDVRGRRVRTLHAGHRAAGPVELAWDGRGEDGRRLPSGSYFARVVAAGTTGVQRISLLR